VRVERSRAVGTRRHRVGFATALCTSVVVLVAVALVSAATFLLSPAGNSLSASFIPAQPGSLHWNGRDRLNVLLLGTTSRSSTRGTTATMILASFDPHSHTIALLSIPGSLWVSIPGYGRDRIANAYADGDARLAVLVTESVTHVAIPYYAVAGYDSFKQLVDAFGGVTLPVSQTMQRMYPSLRGGNSPAMRPVRGLLHANGAQALVFAGAAQPTGFGDIGRMQRQQRLLIALKSQGLQPQLLFRIPTIINGLGGNILTNFPYDQIASLAHLLSRVPRANVHSAFLDRANGAVTRYAAGGTEVLLPNWQRIHSLTQRMFPNPQLRAPRMVEVLNGSGVAGQASSLGVWLRSSGVGIKGDDSARSYNYPHSEVMLTRPSQGHAVYVAHAVAALLQVPLVIRPMSKSKGAVVVITGRDYTDPGQQ
jgi:LCP family protein required for cell wall assembly